MKRIVDILLAVFAATILAGPGLWLLAVPLSNYSNEEGRKLATFPSLSFRNFKTASKRILQGKSGQAKKLFYGQFLEQSFQDDVSTALTDQFPLRIRLVWLSRAIERANISLAYLLAKDNVIPVSSRSPYLVTRDGMRLMPLPEEFTEANKTAIDSRIQNYADLIERYPDVNFYAYYIEWIAYSNYHPLVEAIPLADRGQSTRYFLENKPAGLTVGALIAENYQQYDDWFYRTDHHWDVPASWQAYQEIYQMIAPRYPGISPMLQAKGFLVVPGVEFCGSYARKSLYPCHPDELRYVDVDLPPFQAYEKDKPAVLGKMADYLRGNFSLDKYANHYGIFFGANHGIQKYAFDNDSTRNLLMIVDSFACQNQVYIASHFHTTVVVDLRYDNDFSLEETLRHYNITDILILGYADVVFGLDWTLSP